MPVERKRARAPNADFTLIGLEPSGKIDQVIPDRAAFGAQAKASTNGKPITDLGGDKYRLQLDLDHVGWSGILLLTGKEREWTLAYNPNGIKERFSEVTEDGEPALQAPGTGRMKVKYRGGPFEYYHLRLEVKFAASGPRAHPQS